MAHANIIVLGCAGVGKSSYLKDTFGIDAKTGRSAFSVTQETRAYDVQIDGVPTTFWDCPGVFDGERTLQTWTDEVLSQTGSKSFHQVLYIVNASTRPGTLDTLVLICLRHFMGNIKLDRGVTVVFTHCDAAPEAYDPSFRAEWVKALNIKCRFEQKGIPLLDEEKTVAFTRKESLAIPHIAKEAKQHEGKPGVGLGARAATVVMAAAKVQTQVAFTPKPIETRQGYKEIMKEVVETCGKDAAEEYVCYDAATAFVLRRNADSGLVEKVLATDIEVGDQIMGDGMVPEEVLIKNVQMPKCAVMRAVSAATDANRHYSMTLSFGHFVPVWRQLDQGRTLVPSRDLQVGDLLQVVAEDGSLEFARVDRIEDIIVSKTISLRTRSLTMVVNGVVGSCRAEGDAGPVGHLLVLLASMLFKNGGQKLQDLAWAVEGRFRVMPKVRQIGALLS